jgi:hypothetical protein
VGGPCAVGPNLAANEQISSLGSVTISQNCAGTGTLQPLAPARTDPALPRHRIQSTAAGRPPLPRPKSSHRTTVGGEDVRIAAPGNQVLTLHALPKEHPLTGQRAGWTPNSRIKTCHFDTLDALVPRFSLPGRRHSWRNQSASGRFHWRALPSPPLGRDTRRWHSLVAFASHITATGQPKSQCFVDCDVTHARYCGLIWANFGQRAVAFRKGTKITPFGYAHGSRPFWAILFYFSRAKKNRSAGGPAARPLQYRKPINFD